MISSEEVLCVVGISTLFIGIMCIVGGWLGVREEKKKFGIKRKATKAGEIALILGILSVFLPNFLFYMSLILGFSAIILAIKAVREGDNEYGLSGGICGVIGIILKLLIFYIISLA